MKKLLYLLLLVTGVSYGQTAAVIAHRGGSALAPENTLSAFSNAISLNADYYECDVQMSSDDSLIIMHDATVDRTTDGTGSIANKTYAELRTLDAGSWFSSAFTGEKVPTLYEVLNLARNSGTDTKVIIELKSSETDLVSKVVAMVQKLKMEPNVIIASFNLTQITASKAADPTIRVMLFGTITTAMIDQVKAIYGEWVGSGGTITQSLIDYAHTQNVEFNAWTINSAIQMQPLIDMGIDAITTDYPDVAIALQDDTPPSDVVLTSAVANETLVSLTWDAATDEESGVTGYEIYRDATADATTLLAKVGKVTTYDDQTYTELTQYYYRVKAVNLADMTSTNYSNELDVTTGADITKPTVKYITSFGDSTTVIVGFSERVSQTTAEVATNYTINNDITVSSAQLLGDQMSVVLTTSPMQERSYLLTVKNVTDLATTPNKMVTVSKVFIHKAIHADAVAIYQLDEFDIVEPDTFAIDETENNNFGIVKNGVTLEEGVLGNAYRFDGTTGYVQLATSSSFDLPDATGVTISLWAKLDYLPTELPVAYGPLFDSDGDQYVLYQDKGNSELRFKVATTASAERPGIANADLVTGEWIHICGVYDGSTAKIYLNGEVKDSHNLTGTVKTGQVACLGRNGTGTQTFAGAMDQVEVYNRGLSAEEVMDKYLNTKALAIERNPLDVENLAASVNGTDVILTWDDVVNYESDMMGYEIYRDETTEPTTLYATVGNVTTWTDKTNAGNKTFYYRVKAKNVLGLKSPEFSNEVSAVTGADVTRPIILYATSVGDANELIIEFSEAVDQSTAENAANYALDQSATVYSAALQLDKKTVIMATSALNPALYTLTVNNVTDLATTPNSILPDFKVKFEHKDLSTDLIAAYSLNDLPVVGTDTMVYDLTANDNDGIAHMLPVVSEGYLGNAVMFDENSKQYVQFNQSSSYDINDTLVTVSVWTKLTYLPVEMPLAYGPLFDSDGDQYVIYADRGNKELRFKTATDKGAERPGIPNNDLITGQWIHVVGVYNGSTAKIYLNGVLKDTHNLTGTVKPGQVAMLAKSGVAGTPAYFTGPIDQVQVYKTALTEEEVLDLYENTKVKAQYDCEAYATTEDVTICVGESYTFPDGISSSVSVTHVSYFTSMYGCDSTITTNLTVQVVDATVAEDNGVLSVTSGGDEFQWIDCDNGNAVISGATSSSYTATEAGNYAVIVTYNGCTNTSECVYTTGTAVDNSTAGKLNLFPNPNSGRFTIDLDGIEINGGKLEIFNTQGQLIYAEQLNGQRTVEITLPEGTKGLYLVKVSNNETLRIKQMVVN